MSQTTGRVTLPGEAGFLNETKEMMRRWGADALRDSDGTELSDEMKKLDAKIYSTYFVCRGHNEHAEKHMDECQQLYLMSRHNTAPGPTLKIHFIDGYFTQQVTPDYRHDPKKWWEVIDRTTQQAVPAEDWEVDAERGLVTVHGAKKFHEYTVSFLVYAIWDPVEMYNHITNDWGGKPHDIPFDVRQPYSGKFMREYLENWLKENPDTDVVRFTTFFYNFTLVFNDVGKEKYVDWFGYGTTVSVRALKEFEKEKGYALRPEDLVDNGYYNTPFRVPSKHYLDYMDFIQKFVCRRVKELVEEVHRAGKEAMMFLGDNWIGTEPYGKYFAETNLDAVVGSVGSGATLRMISDIPNVKYTEGRFLPYFFPDVFREGNDPCIEAEENWTTARRAILRKPVDRIGYGGYLSLACRFPKFVDYVERVTDEFRLIYSNIGGSKPYSGLNVAVLNSWGRLRSWQTHMVSHAIQFRQTYSYLGVLEALSGASVNVSFLSFADVKERGVPEDVDVVINAGDAGTAFSGGGEWLDEKLVTVIREWIYNGGGLIGVGEPSAVQHGGRFFQLAEAFGVDREVGYCLSTDKYFTEPVKGHFITEGRTEAFDFGVSMKNVYALAGSTELLEYSGGGVHLAANGYGKGRAVYLAGLPYSPANTRLLMRSMFYAAHREAGLKKWYADNVCCEVNAYPDVGKFAVVNNSNEKQRTLVYDGGGGSELLELEPYEIRWGEI